MTNKKKNVIIILLILVVLVLLARFVFFKDKIDEIWAWLQRIETWKQDYKIQNPDATDEQIDQAWEDSIRSLEERQENYRKENPGATQEEIDQAWDDARGWQ